MVEKVEKNNHNRNAVDQAAKNFQNLAKNMYMAYRNAYVGITKNIPVVKDFVQNAFSISDRAFGIVRDPSVISSEGQAFSDGNYLENSFKKQIQSNNKFATVLQNKAENLSNQSTENGLKKSKKNQISALATRGSKTKI